MAFLKWALEFGILFSIANEIEFRVPREGLPTLPRRRGTSPLAERVEGEKIKRREPRLPD